jgi:cysteinyl-tRNA synthetase
MIEFVKVLESRGYTYRLESGLYFDVSRSPDYGRLALLDPDATLKARIESVEGKRHPADFALWRSRLGEAPRAMEWDSPWGPGAPGWHLECSVMSMKYLGDHFDIHTGGVDHREVHHVNEIAQSEAYLADGKPWVDFWLHNEFLLFSTEKMSKSAGGTIRLQNLIDEGYHPMVFRHFVLTAHYRSKMNFSYDALEAADASLWRLLLRMRGRQTVGPLSFQKARERLRSEKARSYLEGIDEAVSADLNTPRVLAVLDALSQDVSLESGEADTLVATADAILGLGLLETTAEDLSTASIPDSEKAEIALLLQNRDDARKRRDWPNADRIRRQLEEKRIEVMDTPVGPRYRRRRG